MYIHKLALIKEKSNQKSKRKIESKIEKKNRIKKSKK